MSPAIPCVDVEAPTGGVHGSLQLPALAPGQAFSASVWLALPRSSNADRMYVTAALDPEAPENPAHDNDLTVSRGFYLSNPRLDLSLRTGPFREEIQVANPAGGRAGD